MLFISETWRRFVSPALALTCALLCMIAGPLLWPQGLATKATAQGKLSAHLLKEGTGQGDVEFLVILKDKTNLSPAFALADRDERGTFTRDALYHNAEASQGSLRSWLEQEKLEYRPFFIVNAIWVKASLDAALEIAGRDEVERIEANPVINNRLPKVDPNAVLSDAVKLAEEMRRISSIAAIEPGVSLIRAPQVWADGFKGQGIVIGGADTGIQWDHTVLKGHYRGWNGTSATHDFNWHDSIHSGGGSCGANTIAPCDDNGHGTHTVGTALGDDGGINQVGVAPDAKFIGCRNMDQGNGTPASYLECMEFFLAPYPINGTPAQGDPSKRPHVTINSWTCPPSEGCAVGTLQAAVQAQRAAGIMMVVAAGNEGSACSSIGAGSLGGPPSLYDAAYTVGAIDANNGVIAGFSSRGPITIDGSNRIKPDITAPGVTVRSANNFNGFNFLNGTSMATPHVAGAIALLWSAEPALQRQIDITETLLNATAIRVNTAECSSTGIPNNVYGFGKLDIKAAVDASRPTIAQSTYNVASGPSVQTVHVTALSVVPWAATSNAPWITISSSQNVTGNGSVSFQIAANGGTTIRSGTLTVAGKVITVNQAGSATYQVSGHVRNGATPIAAVSMTFVRLSGTGNLPAAVTTDAQGNWTQTGFEAGSTYRAMATLGRTAFSPRTIEFNGAASNLNFNVVNRGIHVSLSPTLAPASAAARDRVTGRVR